MLLPSKMLSVAYIRHWTSVAESTEEGLGFSCYGRLLWLAFGRLEIVGPGCQIVPRTRIGWSWGPIILSPAATTSSVAIVVAVVPWRTIDRSNCIPGPSASEIRPKGSILVSAVVSGRWAGVGCISWSCSVPWLSSSRWIAHLWGHTRVR